MNNKTLWRLTPLAVAVALAAPVQAQTLEEVVVTAQKRSQNLQDVGISVTAMSGEMLKDMGITEISKLQDSTPNLRINKDYGGSSTPNFAIRGVGSLTNTSAVSSSPVAIHVNEVPYAFPVTTGGALFDLAGVEVLRGPQGDLFGLNTTGGTVNFTTAKPTEEFEASVTADIGNYKTKNFDGFVSGPLTDNLGMRLAIHSENRDEGYQTNRRLNIKNGEIERLGARWTTSYNTDSFNADIEIHYSEDKSDIAGLRLTEDYSGVLGNTATAAPGVYDTDWSENTSYFGQNKQPFVDNKGLGGSMRMNLDLDNGMTLTSVTGIEDFDRLEYSDWDGSVLQDGDNVFSTKIKSYSEEIRLESSQDGELTWMVGVNYGQDDIDSINVFDQADNPAFPAAAGQNFKQERKMWSVFSHAEFQMSDEIQLIGGLRWTEESRDVENIGTFMMNDPLGAWAPFVEPATRVLGDTGSILTGCIANLYGADEFCAGDVFSEVLLDGVDIQKEYKGINAKLAVNWTPNDEALYYASLSHGFKAGGYGDIPASSWAQFEPSEKETLTAYEIGSKLTLADGSLRVNSAVFFYDYVDQQVGGTYADIAFGPLGTTVNAPKSEMYGLELEVLWAASESIEISQGFGYTKGTYKEYTAVDGDKIRDIYAVTGVWATVGDGNNITSDRSGLDIGFPEVQYNGSFKYTTDIADDLAMRLTMDYSYEGREINSLSSDNLESYWLVNARAALFSEGDWEATLWVENLQDKVYLNFRGGFNNSEGEAYGMPRTYGLRLTKNF